jgi:hypothetical protein
MKFIQKYDDMKFIQKYDDMKFIQKYDDMKSIKLRSSLRLRHTLRSRKNNIYIYGSINCLEPLLV